MEKVIYEPNKYLKMGIAIWPSMARELIDSRELIWRLFKRDLLAKYKQSFLGFIWILGMPLVAIGTFMYLNKSGVIAIGQTDVPYPLFALLGLTVWQVFATGLNSGCQSLVSAGDMIGKIDFPREVLVIASMAQTAIEFIVKFFFIILFSIILDHTLSWKIILFPVLTLPILILTLAFSLNLSLLTGILRDTVNAVSLLTTFLMFLTPVFYPIPESSYFFTLNPLTALVNTPRDIVVYGAIQDPMSFIFATGLSLLLFLISWRIFHLVETKIPERI